MQKFKIYVKSRKRFYQDWFWWRLCGQRICFQNGSLESEGKPSQKLSSNITNQLFSNFQTLGLKQVEFENPGITYNFIEYQLNGVTKRLVWNPSDKTVQSELQLFYNNFNYYIKKNIK